MTLAETPGARMERIGVDLVLNGQKTHLDIEPWTTLLDVLREQLHMTGTKKGCDHGQCGACTVLVDGTRINSCLALAVMQDGKSVTTIEARINVTGPGGDRTIPIADFHRLPGDRPEIDTTLKGDELIVSVDLPDEDLSKNFTYLKLRDRASYAFALVSVAVSLRLEDGRIAVARVALGSVAAKPWRNIEAERALVGQAPGHEAFARFADTILAEAKAQTQNAFKIPLAKRAIVRALRQAADGTPQTIADKTIQ